MKCRVPFCSVILNNTQDDSDDEKLNKLLATT